MRNNGSLLPAESFVKKVNSKKDSPLFGLFFLLSTVSKERRLKKRGFSKVCVWAPRPLILTQWVFRLNFFFFQDSRFFSYSFFFSLTRDLDQRVLRQNHFFLLDCSCWFVFQSFYELSNYKNNQCTAVFNNWIYHFYIILKKNHSFLCRQPTLQVMRQSYFFLLDSVHTSHHFQPFMIPNIYNPNHCFDIFFPSKVFLSFQWPTLIIVLLTLISISIYCNVPNLPS